MSRQQGEQMQALHGALRTVTATTHPQETNVGATALPNSEPGTSQIIYTVADGDLPTFSIAPKSWINCGDALAMGQCTGGTGVTINYRLLKNTASVRTGTFAVAAGYYWSMSAMDLVNIVVGDVIELRLWLNAGQTGCNYTWQGLGVTPSRIQVEPPGTALLACALTNGLLQLPTYGGVSQAYYNVSPYINDVPLTQVTTSITVPVWYPGPTYGLGRSGDDNTPGVRTLAGVALVNYYTCGYVASFAYRPGPRLT